MERDAAGKSAGSSRLPGTDSFAYQFGNDAGTETSNPAIVTLSVCAINDAAVAADVAVTMLADSKRSY